MSKPISKVLPLSSNPKLSHIRIICFVLVENRYPTDLVKGKNGCKTVCAYLVVGVHQKKQKIFSCGGGGGGGVKILTIIERKLT